MRKETTHLHMHRITFEDTGVACFDDAWFVEQEVILDPTEENPVDLTVLPGVTKQLHAMTRVPEPGLYYVFFKSDITTKEAKAATADNEPAKYTASTIVEVANTIMGESQ